MAEGKKTGAASSRGGRKKTKATKEEAAKVVAESNEPIQTADVAMEAETPADADAKSAKREPRAEKVEASPEIDSQEAREEARASATPSSPTTPQTSSPGGGVDPNAARKRDEYVVQIYYDRTNKTFVGLCLEFPELRVSGGDRDRVNKEICARIENHINNLRRRGETVPEPLSGHTYPEKLEIQLSQSLQRKLDMLSRQERVPMNQLVSDLLNSAFERRHETRPQPQPHNNRNEHRNQNHGHNNHGNNNRQNNYQQGNGPNGNRRGQGGGGARGGRGYHDVEKTDNFLEYVRNLEKGNFRKK